VHRHAGWRIAMGFPPRKREKEREKEREKGERLTCSERAAEIRRSFSDRLPKVDVLRASHGKIYRRSDVPSRGEGVECAGSRSVLKERSAREGDASSGLSEDSANSRLPRIADIYRCLPAIFVTTRESADSESPGGISAIESRGNSRFGHVDLNMSEQNVGRGGFRELGHRAEDRIVGKIGVVRESCFPFVSLQTPFLDPSLATAFPLDGTAIDLYDEIMLISAPDVTCKVKLKSRFPSRN